jgi:hypothetical protein
MTNDNSNAIVEQAVFVDDFAGDLDDDALDRTSPVFASSYGGACGGWRFREP